MDTLVCIVLKIRLYYILLGFSLIEILEYSTKQNKKYSLILCRRVENIEYLFENSILPSARKTSSLCFTYT